MTQDGKRARGGKDREQDERDDALAASTNAIVIVPVLTGTPSSRSPEARLEEAVGLADAIDLDTVHAETVNLGAPRPATLIGTGKLKELADKVEALDVGLVVIDHALSPVQQRNLERALDTKVLDRTGLILEIFGRRARTREGSLQVELAHLNYQRGRLVRSWTHLERQRGGAGFMGGPGETQIEADRRLLQERIVRLKRELETVQRTRELHRAKRRKVPFPIVAIVGYTNAGKSTLFNRLTGASVMARDMLFATLDPTLRRLKLPHGTTILLSDTVGFISDLPTHLVAAFRATLEEVVEADIVLHLRDLSDPDSAAQAEDVDAILTDLGVDTADESRVIEVWNKVDLMDEDGRAAQLAGERQDKGKTPIVISAMTGEGIDGLLTRLEERLAGAIRPLTVTIPPDKASLIAWAYRNGQVENRIDHEDGSVELTLQAPEAICRQLQADLAAKGSS